MAIKVLDTKVISQIAAGEVIERPSSVVKELVENALDAEANQISVEISEGGLSLIRVTDNGHGIPDNEVQLAFQRHATSKITALQDLQQLTTLGFRGEALPSIAAVAKIQMVTARKGSESGTQVVLEDGSVVNHETYARVPGTTISVHNLFKKLPARLKFLKSSSTEASKIANVVSQYALAYPEVRFTLINEGKNTLRSSGSGKLIDSVIAVYGLEVAQNLLEVSTQPNGFSKSLIEIKISGLVGLPQVARSTRNFLSFFVNRRWVSSRYLSYAIEEAYQGLLMQGKHPFAVINITLPPSEIDVNVHPAKTEIKFQDEKAVFSAVQKAVRTCLIGKSPVPQIEEFKRVFNIPATPFTTMSPKLPAIHSAYNNLSSALPIEQPTPLVSLPLLRVLGQLARNYIVAEGPDGLYLLDQHAAHERIMLEQIRRQRTLQKVEIQGLLQPISFELDPRQSVILESNLSLVNEFGFDIQFFGNRSFLVRAVPAILKDRDWMAVLQETIDTQSGDWSENLLNRLACHSAIRSGQVLREEDMRELVKQLEQTALPNSCPHGRPTMIRLTISQLEKEFGRT